MSENILFRTPVETPPSRHPIQPHDGCVLLGSCFAQEMAKRMSEYRMDVLCNPLGTLYNPASINMLVHKTLHHGKESLPMFEQQGKWYCWLAGTQVSGHTEDSLHNAVSLQLQQLKEALLRASHLIVTLGTNICYRLKEDGSVVANCHKMPARLFAEDTLPIRQCTDMLTNMAEELLASNPNLHITFTVSPYRYAKYGLHRSQLAKATLLLAVDEVCSKVEQADYFPAYEILTDELRDYRFYADDMFHPSSMAVDFIWKRFCQTYLSERTRCYLKEYDPIRKGLSHKPSDSNSTQHRAFLLTLAEKAKRLREKYGMKDVPSDSTSSEIAAS